MDGKSEEKFSKNRKSEVKKILVYFLSKKVMGKMSEDWKSEEIETKVIKK